MSTAPQPHSQVYGPQAPTAEDERVQEAVLKHLHHAVADDLTVPRRWPRSCAK